MACVPATTLAAPAVEAGADRCGPALLGVGGELVTGVVTVNVDAFRKGWLGGQGEALEGAKAAARLQATAELRRQVCDGLVDDRDCDAEMALAMPVVERLYEGERWACAVTGVERDRLGSNTTAGRATGALARLGQQVGAELTRQGVRNAVRLDIVRTPGGCTAVGLEAARQQVAGALGAAGIGVLADRTVSTAAWSVELEATLRGKEIQVLARVVDPGADLAVAVAPVTLPSAAFDVTSLAMRCAAPVQPRVGTDGLVARLSMPTVLCAGQVLAPELEVSRQARVQVWSVSPDGVAYLVEPALSWSGTGPLPSGRAIPPSASGDEVVVAVALPADASPPANAPDRFCRVAALDASWIPAGAAVAVQGFHVQTNPGRCPKAAEVSTQVAALQAALDAAPSCP